MTRTSFTLILIIGLGLSCIASSTITTSARFASEEKAKTLLTSPDAFTNSWSAFDIDSRLHTPNGTKTALFEFISKQVRAWSTEEEKLLTSIFKRIDSQVKKQGLSLKIPDEIYFVKTTAKEEGGALGYTRANYIVLKEGVLSLKEESLKELIIHELFHVLTRANPQFRQEMYAIIGFELSNEIEYPEALKESRITNPDAPQCDSFIKLEVAGESVECMMVLYATRPYTDGEFFEYLSIGFLVLSEAENKSAKLKDGKPIIYSIPEVTGFFEQVGKNTEYIIHPEEILAENFTLVVENQKEAPNQELLVSIKNALKK